MDFLRSRYDYAEVAELVDALGSGSSGGISVGVRVSPSAPSIKNWPQSQEVAAFRQYSSPKLTAER